MSLVAKKKCQDDSPADALGEFSVGGTDNLIEDLTAATAAANTVVVVSSCPDEKIIWKKVQETIFWGIMARHFFIKIPPI